MNIRSGTKIVPCWITFEDTPLAERSGRKEHLSTPTATSTHGHCTAAIFSRFFILSAIATILKRMEGSENFLAADKRKEEEKTGNIITRAHLVVQPVKTLLVIFPRLPHWLLVKINDPGSQQLTILLFLFFLSFFLFLLVEEKSNTIMVCGLCFQLDFSSVRRRKEGVGGYLLVKSQLVKQ